MITADNTDSLDAHQLPELVATLRADVLHKQKVIEKLTHENAVLKRLKFAAQSERFNTEQRSLLGETLDADLLAVSEEIERLAPPQKPKGEANKPKREPLPAELSRREIRHEPENTTCSCGCQMKRIGEDVRRQARLPAWRLYGGAPCALQVGLHQVREAGAGTGGCAHDRQGRAHQRICSRRSWLASSPTTCRCIDRKRSLGVLACRLRDRRWPSGSEPAADGCSRWWMP